MKIITNCILALLIMLPFHRANSAEVDAYKSTIRELIENDFSDVIASNVKRLLLSELERPLAIGGKSRHHPPSESDLDTGWEIFGGTNFTKAIAVVTVGDIHSGNAKQVTAKLYIYNHDAAPPSLSLTIQPFGQPSTVEELESIRMSISDLEGIGIDMAGEEEEEEQP